MKVKVIVRQKPNPQVLHAAVAAALQRIRLRLEETAPEFQLENKSVPKVRS